MKKITENDPTHPPGCHVMHATGEWHFNPLRPDFNPDLIVKGVHQICKAVKGLLDEFPWKRKFVATYVLASDWNNFVFDHILFMFEIYKFAFAKNESFIDQ